jgi:hypothetical protein
MQGDPFIVTKGVVLDNRRDHTSDGIWIKALSGLAVTVGCFVWVILRPDLSREPELPDRPLTKADVPLIEKKIAYLKKDAETGNREKAQFFMAQANDLSQKLKALEGISVPPPAAVVPASANRYGVKVGDIVDISALNPVIAAHHAVITDMNDEQLKIRVDKDTFAIRWENVDRLKAESK